MLWLDPLQCRDLNCETIMKLRSTNPQSNNHIVKAKRLGSSIEKGPLLKVENYYKFPQCACKTKLINSKTNDL